MPPHHTKSKLQAVLEESTSTNVAKHPSVTTAVKSMASVLLGPRGKTPIENIMTMQHFQLWGFILVVVGLIYIVWLMQKKLDSIDKQYKEQFVLLHRLFKSHQDLQVEVRKKSGSSTMSAAPVSNVVVPPPTQTPTQTPTLTPTLTLEDEEEIDFENSMNNHTSDENQTDPHDPQEPEKQTSEDDAEGGEDEDELVEETEDDEEQPEGEDETEDLDYEEYDVADE